MTLVPQTPAVFDFVDSRTVWPVYPNPVRFKGLYSALTPLASEGKDFANSPRVDYYATNTPGDGHLLLLHRPCWKAVHAALQLTFNPLSKMDRGLAFHCSGGTTGQ